MRTIRITSIPRELSPGAAYHPVFFAEKDANEIWALPGVSAPLKRKTKVRLFFFEKLSQRVFPRSAFWRGLALLTLLPRIVLTGDARYIVHSYVYALPFCLLSRKPLVIIHGTDRRWLSTGIGRFIAKRTDGLFAVGDHQSIDGIEVQGIPNIFALNLYKNRPECQIARWQVAFVLRDAPVKNPEYPEKLRDYLGNSSSLRVCVIGLDGPASTGRSVDSVGIVDYLGVIDPEQVANVLYDASVLVIPSHSEGVSKAMLEGLAAGCTVLASESIAIPDELKKMVERMDLNDFPAVVRRIELAASGSERNKQGAQAVRAYLKNATDQLTMLYS